MSLQMQLNDRAKANTHYTYDEPGSSIESSLLKKDLPMYLPPPPNLKLKSYLFGHSFVLQTHLAHLFLHA